MVKSLDSFDFAALPSLNKTLVLELARSEYVARRENLIAVMNGPACSPPSGCPADCSTALPTTCTSSR